MEGSKKDKKLYMALPTPFILKDNQLLSFQVGFSSYRPFRKAHTLENSKAKSWGRGILDLDFDTRKCVIRNGEHTLLVQSFTEFLTIETREDDSDQFLTITFDSDEWDIIPQNVAETACIMHLAQYIGKDQIISATEVVRSGAQKGIIGLEQTPILKQGLVQQHDQDGRILQARFLIVVPGKLFGFQRQQEMVDCPVSFATSLFNARVTTLVEIPGFQLHVDRSEPLYFDTLQDAADVERPSWIKELNASIEFTKGALNGIFVMTRPPARTSKVQWKETHQDVQQQLSNSTGSSNDHGNDPVVSIAASTSQKDDVIEECAGLEPSHELPAGADLHYEESRNGETDAESHARSKPLSRARICLEDSLSELKILVGHIEASSYVLNDLRLFTSSTYPREKKKYVSLTASRWPSTGKERSWPHTYWQDHYLSESSHQDPMIWPKSSSSSKSEYRDLICNTSDYAKELYEPFVAGRQKEACTAPYFETSYQKQPAHALGEPGQVQANNESSNISTENMPLDARDYKTGRKSSSKLTRSLDVTGDVNEVQSIESDAELPIPSYSETQENGEATSSQKLSAKYTMKKSSMNINPSLPRQPSARQPSARASRAVAFMAHPDILNTSDDNASSQMRAQPQLQTVVITKRISDDSVGKQSSSIGKPRMASKLMASQPEFPLMDYPHASGEDLREDNLTSTRQSGPSERKSTQQAPGYTQPRQSVMQSGNVTELTADRNKGGSGFDTDTPSLPNHEDSDGVALPENDDAYGSMPSTFGDSYNQASDSLVLKSRDKVETRKSTANYHSSFVGNPQAAGRTQTDQAANEETVMFQPETRKGLAGRQRQESSFQPDASFQSETKKNSANRQNQKAMSVPDLKKSIALNRKVEDATFPPEIRKIVHTSRQSAGDLMQPAARKSMVPNRQNQDSMSQPDMRKSFAANRQTSIEQPSALSNAGGTPVHPPNGSSNLSVQSVQYTGGELRKSLYQGGGNLQAELDFKEQDTNQLSGEMYDRHQDGDSSDMTSSASSSYQSSTDPLALDEPAMPEPASKLSSIGSPITSAEGEILAPAAPAKLENRKTRVTAVSNNRSMEQVAASSNQQHITLPPSRASAYESSRPFMRSNTTRGIRQSYINFDDSARGVDGSSSRRRYSQS